MARYGLAWALGSAGLVALSGCVPAELRLEDGDEAGQDATVDAHRDARTADGGEVVDASLDRTAGDAGPIEDSATHDSGPADVGATFRCGDLAACTAPNALCCASTTAVDHDADTATTTYSCANGSCDAGTPILCDEASQCEGGVCCGTLNTEDTAYIQVECQPTCNEDAGPYITFCNPSASPSVCTPLGQTCVGSVLLSGFHVCGS